MTTQKTIDWSKPKDSWACPIPHLDRKIATAVARQDLPAVNQLIDDLYRLDNEQESEELYDLFDAQCAIEMPDTFDKAELAIRLAHMAAQAKRHGDDPEVIRDLTDALKTLRAR